MSESFQALFFSLICALTAFGGLRANTIVIKGSDTLGAKLVPLLSESFNDQRAHPDNIIFEIAAEGSSTGIAAVSDGTALIGLSSRRPTSLEQIHARSSGVELTPITVARDGIAVIVNHANPVDALSLRELESIFAGDRLDWASVSNFRGNISVYTRNTSSGTYGAFMSLAMRSRNYGTRAQKMASNEQIVSEVAQNPFGIGYVGLAYINSPDVKVISVDSLSPADGSEYPLSRPLYFLIDQNSTLSRAANDFIGFTLSPAGQRIVSSVNFIPAY